MTKTVCDQFYYAINLEVIFFCKYESAYFKPFLERDFQI